MPIYAIFTYTLYIYVYIRIRIYTYIYTLASLTHKRRTKQAQQVFIGMFEPSMSAGPSGAALRRDDARKRATSATQPSW